MPTLDRVRALAVALLLSACTESGDETVTYDEAGTTPGPAADAQRGPATDAAASADAAVRPDAAADATVTALDAASRLDASNAEPSRGEDGSSGVLLDANVQKPPDSSAPPDAGSRDSGAGPGGVGNDGGSDSGPSSGPQPPAGKPLVGVYCGNSVDGVRQFEQWLGRPVDGILGYSGNADWADYDGSVGWATGLWSAIDRRVFWSVPLIVNGASLAQAGAGAYDEHYRKAAQTLSSWRPQEPKLYIRTGWEFNGNWFPWSGQGKAADFKAAFRRFVTVFRSVSDRFVFEWNVNVGDVGMDPETAYPGDDVVDIVGMDFYWQTHLPSNPQQAWSQMVNQKWGLKWHQDFAKAHDKPTAYSEWGVRYDNAGYYIEQAKLWFDQHPVVYHNYWNADNDYPGKLSDGQYAATGAAYKAAFGR